MGLDMFVWRVAANDAIDDLTIRSEEDGRERELEELFYWRKHHDLHGWMEKLYRNKGGTAQSIGCYTTKEAAEEALAGLKNEQINSYYIVIIPFNFRLLTMR